MKAALTVVILSILLSRQVAAAPLSFNHDIRPILSEKCFSCHGFDAKKRKGELRLDDRAAAIDPKREHIAIIPGNAKDSEVIKRMLQTDPEEVMPPKESVHKATERDIAIVSQWINEGATYQPHWAFIPPVRAAIPASSQAKWVRNPIDSFIAAKLDAEKVSPSPETDKATLLRRLSFDLTGLPPSREEMQAFMSDSTPDAYEKIVDRLLASPHYGERMALPWLDAARYADSNGFQQDGDTHQYMWRDWVIRALNNNMPFDQFAIEQIAGDLLPNATTDQKIATAFNRLHLNNGEGGNIPEEQRNIILYDRVDVTATNWLGITLACAQCHDHKYDPFTQKDYYSMMAFFNNVPERGVPEGGGQYRIAEPSIVVGTEEQQAQLASIDGKIQANTQEEAAIKKQPEFETQMIAAENFVKQNAPAAWAPVSPSSMSATDAVILSLENDRSIVASGALAAKANYTLQFIPEKGRLYGVRFDLIPDARFPLGGAGRAESGNAVLSKLSAKQGEKAIEFSRVTADYSQGGFSPEAILDANPETGWAFVPDVAKPHQISLEFAAPIESDGQTPITFLLEFQSKHLAHMFGRFRVSFTSAPAPLMSKNVKPELLALVTKDPAARSPEEKKQLRTALLELDPLGLFHANSAEKKKLLDQQKNLQNAMPRVMVMSDAKPRVTHIQDRGSYTVPLGVVTSNTPDCLPPIANQQAKNRIDLAKWLVSSQNPLASRVQVNRIWQTYFGVGFVKTAENFGAQSEMPNHQELLDWLAVEFRESGWDMKKLHRLIVTSATYRQSSKVSAAMLERDPENKLLARSARFRLPSMMIRDLALATSGLLEQKMYGKPVYPYQPPTIWDGLSITKERDFTYPLSTGADLYRRSIYTFWRRTVAPGNMFDMSERRTCVVKNSTTSSPLHALTTMNDTTWVEASRVLAQRLMLGSSDASSWTNSAFEIICQRPPDDQEKEILRRAFDHSLEHFGANNKAATEFLSNGASQRDASLNLTQHAALAHVCLTIYNLDEALTRQ